MPKRSFKDFVEQELGKFPQFVIFAVFEWILIIILFVDGFLAFLASEFSRFFELEIPCLLCTRIDHVLVHRNSDFYYNNSICDSHKKNVSSFAYCHVHKKLSEMKRMCEACLLSFATEKESDCDTYKSLIGILHKDLELIIDDEQDIQLSLPASVPKKEENVFHQNVDYRTSNSNSGNIPLQHQRCACCGELLKVRSYKPRIASLAPAPSPRVSFNQRNLDLSRLKYTELNKSSDNESVLQEDEDSTNAINRVKEDKKAALAPLLTEPDESMEDRTPSFIRGGNRFFGIPLSDSAQNSPRWTAHPLGKSPLERTENASDMADPNGQQNDVLDGDSILHRLNRQVRLDRKSLMALYMELDEERSASAVAANNAMAMITRLQAEKAAVQMEALQYQRMMEEQAEYDQEALQGLNNLLAKREDEMKELEAELEDYREKYGCLREDEAEEGFLKEQSDNATANSSDIYHETKPVLNVPVCSSNEVSNHKENGDSDRSAPSQQEEMNPLAQKEDSEKKPKVSSDGAAVSVDEPSTNNGTIREEESSNSNVAIQEEEQGERSKTVLVKELSDIQERLRALEASGDLLKHISVVLDASEGEAILMQISQNLHMLRSFVSMPLDA